MCWLRLRIYWHISLLISCCVWISEQWNGSYKQQKNFNDGQVNTGLTLLFSSLANQCFLIGVNVFGMRS